MSSDVLVSNSGSLAHWCGLPALVSGGMVVVLVTGRTGFIGRNLAEGLSARYRVLAPSRQELDLLDENAVQCFFERHTVDAVVHCATTPGHRNAKDPTNLAYKNTRMFFNIVRNSNRFGKMIHLGSGAVYDMRHYVPKMKEEYFDTHVPIDEGGFSKYVCAKYIERSKNIVELRPFGVFGKYEDYEIRFISNAICKAIFDLPITIRQNRRFDYVFIDDLVKIIDCFIWADAKEKFYNITPDESIELRTLAQIVLVVSGKGLGVRTALEGMGTEYSGENRRLRSEFSEISFTPMETAVRQLYLWYCENRERISREALLVDK